MPHRGYSTQLALTLAKAAYLAYQDKQFVAEIVGRWGAALTGRNSNHILRYDFRYFNNQGRDTLSSYKGRVHKGFFLGWAIIEESVLAQIFRWPKDFASKGKRRPPLYVTGHSLGGVLATIAAAALMDHNVEIAGAYTFGQPRVGDRTFVNQLNSRTNGKVFQFVNNNDLVPRVPPPFSVWNPTRFYGHVGKATYFDGRGMITASGSYTLGRRLTNAVWGLAKGVIGSGFNCITDHRMEYYISHLDTALKEEIENKISRLLDVG